ncbi:MAG: cytochrome c oxidase assembly protein [Acetobacteraceae bacterium]
MPPDPGTLLTRWNLDPVLISGLVAVGCLYIAGTRYLARTGSAPGRAGQISFHLGWGITAAALISPLCPLSVSLFAARCGQEMILALLAAPLVIVGRPFTVIGALLGRHYRNYKPQGALFSPLIAAVTYAVVLWFWHAPAPYVATFASTTVYWLMHVTMFGAALWLWAGLLDRAPAHIVPVIGAGIFSSVQMGFLGAVIVFAPRPLYTVYDFTTRAWGLTQLQDQQLGGAIMWVPGCIVFFAVSMVILWLVFERMEAAEPGRSAAS